MDNLLLKILDDYPENGMEMAARFIDACDSKKKMERFASKNPDDPFYKVYSGMSLKFPFLTISWVNELEAKVMAEKRKDEPWLDEDPDAFRQEMENEKGMFDDYYIMPEEGNDEYGYPPEGIDNNMPYNNEQPCCDSSCEELERSRATQMNLF